MKKAVDAIIFIPFYDKEYDMLIDTIRSIEYFVKERYHIIALDDFSPSGVVEKLKKEVPDITVLRSPRKHGGRSGLYVSVATACKYAIENFDFKVFIKMDTDALMVGPSLITDAIEKFKAGPRVGLIGSYRVRADNQPRSWYKWKPIILYEKSFIRPFLSKPRLWNDVLKEARKCGYRYGENVLGGCYILNGECAKKMYQRGYLDYKHEQVIEHSKLGEDVILSLFCKATGYDIDDFGRPIDPMVIALDILPMAKEEVVIKRKAVVHSVKKGMDGENQEELRRYFRSFRK